MTDHLFERQWGWWLRKKRRARIALAFHWFIPVVCIGLSVWGINKTMIKLPQDYSALDQRGVSVTAQFAGCSGGRDRKCRLRVPGEPNHWEYGQNFDQFDGLAVGAPVEVVIDPRDPSRRSTALDVRRRTNQGPGVLFGFSVIIGIAGLASVPFFLRFQRDVLRNADARETQRY